MSRLKVLALVSLAIVGCSGEPALQPFTSDGCSLFPDRAESLGKEWCHCCLEHDVAYWQGGTRTQRQQADQRLKTCVLESTGSEALARVMYEGVRSGGGPQFPTWYRWGYGWKPNRGYEPLVPKQLEQASELLERHRESAGIAACGTGLDVPVIGALINID